MIAIPRTSKSRKEEIFIMWLYACLIFVGYLLGYIISSLFSVKEETDRLMDVYQHGYNTGFEEGKAHTEETEK